MESDHECPGCGAPMPGHTSGYCSADCEEANGPE